MTSISRLAVLLFCTTGAAHAAASTEKLGVPLGKKIQGPITLCSSPGGAMEAGAPCWTKPPTVSAGTQYGFLRVPASSAAQGWGAPGSFEVQIDPTGILRVVTVHSARADEYAEIRSALTERIGKSPRGANAAGPRRQAGWKLDDTVVSLSCGADIGCRTHFYLDNSEDRMLNAAMDMGIR